MPSRTFKRKKTLNGRVPRGGPCLKKNSKRVPDVKFRENVPPGTGTSHFFVISNASEKDNSTNSVSSLILAALPSFRLHMCILMFLIIFATFSLYVTEQVIQYAPRCNPFQDRSNLSPIKDRGVCCGTNFSLHISTYISILSMIYSRLIQF